MQLCRERPQEFLPSLCFSWMEKTAEGRRAMKKASRSFCSGGFLHQIQCLNCTRTYGVASHWRTPTLTSRSNLGQAVVGGMFFNFPATSSFPLVLYFNVPLCRMEKAWHLCLRPYESTLASEQTRVRVGNEVRPCACARICEHTAGEIGTLASFLCGSSGSRH